MRWPQQDHADLGLVEDDNTEDLTQTTAPVVPVLTHRAGAAAPHAHQEREALQS